MMDAVHIFNIRCTLYAEKCPENLFILKLHTLILSLFDKDNRKKKSEINGKKFHLERDKFLCI